MKRSKNYSNFRAVEKGKGQKGREREREGEREREVKVKVKVKFIQSSLNEPPRLGEQGTRVACVIGKGTGFKGKGSTVLSSQELHRSLD